MSESARPLSPYGITRKATVFFGRSTGKGESNYFGTGVLIDLDGFFHVATAKHVVFDEDEQLITDGGGELFFNTKDGGVKSIAIDTLRKKGGVEWVFHPDTSCDLAILPVDIDYDEDDITFVKEDMFVGHERLYQTYDVFYFSYQPHIIPMHGKISPIARRGMISFLTERRTFYIDGFVFPGNSGSPVYLKPDSVYKRFDDPTKGFSTDPLAGKLAGIVSNYMTYQDAAISRQTGRTRVIFEENTGLSEVWSTNYLLEMKDTPEFKAQITSLRSQIENEKK